MRLVVPFALSVVPFVMSCESSPRCGTGAFDAETKTCTCPDAADPSSRCDLPRDDFMVEAHRGARSTFAPGNTLPAFVEAIRLGADVLEGDMQITADGAVVLNHDDTLSVECVYAGAGVAPASRVVAELTAREVALFDCHPGFTGIDSPPRVETVLDLHERANVSFDLELKVTTIDEVDVAMQAIVAYDAACAGCLDGIVRIQSFDADALRHVRAAYGEALEVEISYLALTTDDALASVAEFADVYAPFAVLVSEPLVDDAHDAGLRVLPWTVNGESTMCSLIELGVDGIISDDPGLLARTLVDCR